MTAHDEANPAPDDEPQFHAAEPPIFNANSGLVHLNGRGALIAFQVVMPDQPTRHTAAVVLPLENAVALAHTILGMANEAYVEAARCTAGMTRH
jgi:hypothetical protein